MGWVSASPIAQTGYGRITRDAGYRLIDAGVNITFIGTFGDVVIWGGVHDQVTPGGNKAHILALTDPRSAASVINDYAKVFGFQAIIGFMDCFGLEYLNDVKMPVIGYIPIDGPFTEKMRDYLRNYYKVIAYSLFGYQELQKWYPPSKIGYIPHGVDTDVFRPLNNDEHDEAREWLSSVNILAPPVPKDAFLAMDMGANYGPRKCLPLLMRTWARFVERHKDNPPHLLIHTNPYAPGQGYDLVAHRINLKMEEYIHFPKRDPILHPAKDEDLSKILGASDVFIHNAVAEGFGLPLAEAMACGTPPIGPENSAQTEVIEGNGWLVRSVDLEDYVEFPVYVPTLQQYPIPSQRSLLEKLEEAYNSPDLREEYGKLSREHVVRNYDWSVVIPKWLRLFSQVEEEIEIFKSSTS